MKQLRDARGISILYITHDLATAYQVADTILVLYRAAVVEAGEVEAVIRRPQHPYTQLLIGAVPRVSTVRNWGADDRKAEPATASAGCRFADRCPAVLPQCHVDAPPLYRTQRGRAAACFRLAEHPPLPAEQLDQILTPGPATPTEVLVHSAS